MARQRQVLERLDDMFDVFVDLTTPYSGYETEANKLEEDIRDYISALRYNNANGIRIPKWDKAFEYTGENEPKED